MAGRMIRRLDRVSAAAWGVTGLTVAGLAIRLVGFDDSLYGDELSTYAAVASSQSPADVVHLIRADDDLIATGPYVIELTPPLFFLLSWLGAQVGDPTVTLRLPSLVAGVLTIPVVYLLGLRTVGQPAALVAAGFTAVNPFLIFYSIDARAYALMALLVVVSTLALLRASETGSRWWWAAYAAASCAAIYTHYVAATVLIAQFAWALWFHRERWRGLIVSNLAAALVFLPWLGEFLDDSASPWNVIEAAAPFSVHALVGDIGEWSLGWPPVDTDAIPGTAAMVLAGLGLLIGLASASLPWLRAMAAGWRTRPAGTLKSPSPRVVLIVVTALAAPVLLSAYSAIGPDVLLSRNLIAGSPALMIGVAGLVTAPVASLRILATLLVACGLVIGAVQTFADDAQRPDYRGAARFVEAETKPGEPVFDVALFGSRAGPLSKSLDIYLEGRTVVHPEDFTAAARAVPDGRFALVVFGPQRYELGSHGFAEEPFPPRFSLVDSRLFPGVAQLGAYIFEDTDGPQSGPS